MILEPLICREKNYVKVQVTKLYTYSNMNAYVKNRKGKTENDSFNRNYK